MSWNQISQRIRQRPWAQAVDRSQHTQAPVAHLLARPVQLPAARQVNGFTRFLAV